MLLATFPSQDRRDVIQKGQCSLPMKITHIHHVKKQLRSVPPLSGKSCNIPSVEHIHTKYRQNFPKLDIDYTSKCTVYIIY